MSIQVYGIPNCGTCKKAFQWLKENGIEYEFINLKEHPLNRELLENWVKSLGFIAMRNTSGQSYRDLGDKRNTFTDQEWIEAFANDAMLLKRPLIIKEGTAVVVGFKDKNEVIRQKLGLEL
jgi:arsenate reductase